MTYIYICICISCYSSYEWACCNQKRHSRQMSSKGKVCHDQSSCFFLQDMLLLHFDAAKSHLPRCLICLEEFADGDELKTSLGGGGPDFCFSEGRI